MAYLPASPSPVAARAGWSSRSVLAGCALAAMTAGAGYGVSHYVDLGGLIGAAPAPTAAPAPARVAAADNASINLFDPKLSLGVGPGFVAPPRPRPVAPPAAAPETAATAAAPAQRAAAAKPALLPEEDAGQTDIPLPVARPAPEVAAAEPALAAPEPPRRPADLAPLAPPPRPPLLAARPERAAPMLRPAPLPPATQSARVAPSPRYERTDNFERLIPADAPPAGRAAAPGRARARLVGRGSRSVVARAGAQEPSFFQKLFGAPAHPAGALAYAPTSRLDDAMRPGLGATASLAASSRREVASLGPSDSARAAPAAPRWGGGRAVYDISAQVVTLPDGTRLEAHSGLGAHRDDPRSQRLRMRGVTPPGVYDLREREALFHGVRAIRMTPVGGPGAIHGRNGILAHTYMLGPNGDSNGCVSFRNYNAFLNAFLDGRVSQLVVVEGSGGSSRFAMR